MDNGDGEAVSAPQTASNGEGGCEEATNKAPGSRKGVSSTAVLAAVCSAAVTCTAILLVAGFSSNENYFASSSVISIGSFPNVPSPSTGQISPSATFTFSTLTAHQCSASKIKVS